jgi:hypothetical protein
MTRMKILTVAIGLGAVSLGLGVTLHAAGLSQAMAGLWELSGVPGAKAPVRQCYGDIALLAQYEHRSNACARNVISENGTSAVIAYSCGNAGFGRSKIDIITPRSLRVETQGISGGLPFAYVLQARRVGDCPSRQTALRH